MKIDELGLFLGKAELTALLAFASKDANLTGLYGVQFRATGDIVHARSSNGHIACEAEGECDGVRGEWFIHREFLQVAKKLLDAKTRLRLSFESASLREAVIVDDEDNVRSTLSWPSDAAITQVSIPNLENVIEREEDKAHVFVKVSLSADYLGELKAIASAAGNDRIDCLPPRQKDGPAIYVCQGTETLWRAVIMPLKTEEQDEAPKRNFTDDGEIVDDRQVRLVDDAFEADRPGGEE